MKGFKGFNNIADYSGYSGKCVRTDKERRHEERHCMTQVGDDHLDTGTHAGHGRQSRGLDGNSREG